MSGIAHGLESRGTAFEVLEMLKAHALPEWQRQVQANAGRISVSPWRTTETQHSAGFSAGAEEETHRGGAPSDHKESDRKKLGGNRERNRAKAKVSTKARREPQMPKHGGRPRCNRDRMRRAQGSVVAHSSQIAKKVQRGAVPAAANAGWRRVRPVEACRCED